MPRVSKISGKEFCFKAFEEGIFDYTEGKSIDASRYQNDGDVLMKHNSWCAGWRLSERNEIAYRERHKERDDRS